MTEAVSGARLTPLHELHLELRAKLVPFAGYLMPLQYEHGILHEHLHTRAKAGLFDVSHMGQITIEGPPAALETLVPSDIAGLGPWRQRYSVLTNENGGILDDLMVTRLPERLLVIVNAAFKTEDFVYLRRRLAASCELTPHDDRALLALQGPAAASVLSVLAPSVTALNFMSAGYFILNGIECFVSRSGYTGEDGFEIALPAAAAIDLARTLLADPRVAPAGLGARDSLRLEAGLCLAGADIDETTTPIEAGLSWVVAKQYREPSVAEASFPGAAVVLAQLKVGSTRIRVGVRPQGRIPLRAGVELRTADGSVVGSITSGSFGPSINAPIAMGYVQRIAAAAGTQLTVSIRGREHAAEVAPLPFVPHRYHRK
ncbi:MAG: glycine cleavage system aminomethyltransferase GcvT [Gammaproteobacteria bacterium]|nr:glycine cleavage system aminomethyltransferase GcvT [Gammaproteobacteria bacterium]